MNTYEIVINFNYIRILFYILSIYIYIYLFLIYFILYATRLIEKHESELRQARRQVSLVGSPDLEEGPNSEMTEEMFYECLEAYHDKQDRADEDMRVSKNLQKKAVMEKPKVV